MHELEIRRDELTAALLFPTPPTLVAYPSLPRRGLRDGAGEAPGIEPARTDPGAEEALLEAAAVTCDERCCST